MKFPPVVHQVPLPADDRISAIDFVNRVNWLFEVWDIGLIVEAFLADSTTYHFHGTVHGHDELRRFLTEDYYYLTPGVARNATNHIVDPDGPDGVAVRYHNLLIRYDGPHVAKDPSADPLRADDNDLPAIWFYSPMLDRLRRTKDGWKIAERYVGASVVNTRLSQPD
jgi:SnoaL-like domain